MPKRSIRLEFSGQEELRREYEKNLRSGGTFVRGTSDFAQDEQIIVVLVHPVRDLRISLLGEVVFLASDPEPGLGIAFVNFDTAEKEQLRRFVVDLVPTPSSVALSAVEGQQSAGGMIVDDFPRILRTAQRESPQPEPSEEEVSPDDISDTGPSDPQGPMTESERSAGKALHERLRGLKPHEQMRLAREGTSAERIALERLYGKAVWEPLLGNQRLTIPEVARIARMGSLPRPLIETIAGNPVWLRAAAVRRALLSNPRLSRELVDKVLDTVPRAELKLVPNQTAYPAPVREAARKRLQRL